MARYSLYFGDCLEWMEERAENSIHAIVTDPPYGLKEYTHEEKTKLRNGHGGVWRIPPSFDGCKRSPLPRFTVLTDSDRARLRDFFSEFARRAIRVLVPGGHVFIATNPLLSHLVYLPLMHAGFEKRGEIIRLVKTLRGGRTHTFGIKLPALRFGTANVYQHPKIVLRQSKPTLANGEE